MSHMHCQLVLRTEMAFLLREVVYQHSDSYNSIAIKNRIYGNAVNQALRSSSDDFTKMDTFLEKTNIFL